MTRTFSVYKMLLAAMISATLFVSLGSAQDPLAPAEDNPVETESDEQTTGDPEPNVNTAADPKSESSEQFKTFFDEIATGKTEGLVNMMDPALQALVDEPVLDTLVKAINSNLGAVTSIEIEEPNTEVPTESENGAEELSAKIKFKKGEADARLSLQDGKLMAFNVSSKSLIDWLKKPDDISVYVNGSEQFIKLFMANSGDDAYKMLHPELKKVVSREQFQKMIEQVRAANGELEQVTFESDRWENSKGIGTLNLLYELKCKEKNAACEMKIQFLGMQGQILGFQFK